MVYFALFLTFYSYKENIKYDKVFFLIVFNLFIHNLSAKTVYRY
jgi:hypothetical protein